MYWSGCLSIRESMGEPFSIASMPREISSASIPFHTFGQAHPKPVSSSPGGHRDRLLAFVHQEAGFVIRPSTARRDVAMHNTSVNYNAAFELRSGLVKMRFRSFRVAPGSPF